MLSRANIPGGVWVKSIAGFTWFCNREDVKPSHKVTAWQLSEICGGDSQWSPASYSPWCTWPFSSLYQWGHFLHRKQFCAAQKWCPSASEPEQASMSSAVTVAFFLTYNYSRKTTEKSFGELAASRGCNAILGCSKILWRVSFCLSHVKNI